MKTVALEADHLTQIRVQPQQENDLARLAYSDFRHIQSFESYTILDDSGEPMLCFGFVPIWQGRMMIWSFVSKYAGKHMVGIHKEAASIIDLTEFSRLEAYIDSDHENGARWVKLLGFELEYAGMKQFLPNGKAADMYVRFK